MHCLPKNEHNPSDEQLAVSAQSGDGVAANALADRLYAMVVHVSEGFASFGMEKADCIQEGMIGLISAIRTYNPQMGTRFRTYAKSCIFNHLSGVTRRLNQKKQIPQDKLISINKVSIQDTVLGPEDVLIEREKTAHIMQSLNARLSELELDILKKYLSGYSAAEIAEQLGINVKSVSNALYRIRQKFHSLIK